MLHGISCTQILLLRRSCPNSIIMLLVKITGIVFLFSLAACDLITFKPFVKSRYSVRERTRLLAKQQPVRTNATSGDSIPSGGIQSGSASTQRAEHNMDTTLTPSISVKRPISSHVSEKIDTIATTEMGLKAAKIPADQQGNERREVTTQGPVNNFKTTKRAATTTQTEWVYDYYVSDDENQRTK